MLVSFDIFQKLEKGSSSFRAYLHRARAELEPYFFELFMIRAFFEPESIEPTSSRAFTELLALLLPSPSRAEPSRAELRFDPPLPQGSLVSHVHLAARTPWTSRISWASGTPWGSCTPWMTHTPWVTHTPWASCTRRRLELLGLLHPVGVSHPIGILHPLGIWNPTGSCISCTSETLCGRNLFNQVKL